MTEYQGLVHDLDEDLYHSLPGLSSTGAKKLLKSPAHYKHYSEQPPETKPEFDVGSAVHARVLGVGADIAIYPDGTGTETFEHNGDELTNVLATNGSTGTNAARAFEKDARARGLIPVKRGTAKTIKAMADSVLSDPSAKLLFAQGAPEVSMFGTDPETDVAMRGRTDWLNNRIVDLKTTATGASENDFGTQAFRLGYDVQAAWYEHLHHLITGETLPYLFVVVESTAPFLTAVHRLGDDELLMARRRAREARERYARCLETGIWPGYTTRDRGAIGILRAPVWNINDYIDQFEGATA